MNTELNTAIETFSNDKENIIAAVEIVRLTKTEKVAQAVKEVKASPDIQLTGKGHAPRVSLGACGVASQKVVAFRRAGLGVRVATAKHGKNAYRIYVAQQSVLEVASRLLDEKKKTIEIDAEIVEQAADAAAESGRLMAVTKDYNLGWIYGDAEDSSPSHGRSWPVDGYGLLADAKASQDGQKWLVEV